MITSPITPRRAVCATFVVAGMLTTGSYVLARSNLGKPTISESHWKVPARATKKKNPTKMSAANIAAGKTIFTTNCVMCHGVHGKGNGTAGSFLSHKPANLTTPAFWSQSPGVIFWKLTHGKTPMPAFRATLSRHKRWQVIDYMTSAFKPR